jgi:hypothetical protein
MANRINAVDHIELVYTHEQICIFWTTLKFSRLQIYMTQNAAESSIKMKKKEEEKITRIALS